MHIIFLLVRLYSFDSFYSYRLRKKNNWTKNLVSESYMGYGLILALLEREVIGNVQGIVVMTTGHLNSLKIVSLESRIELMSYALDFNLIFIILIFYVIISF